MIVIFDCQRGAGERLRFYTYKLNGRLATRQEKARLGRLIVRRIPELIPAIKSYPLSEPEQLRPCRKLFQSVKAKKRLTEIGWLSTRTWQ